MQPAGNNPAALPARQIPWRRSLRTRLVLWTSLTSALLLVAVALIFYVAVRGVLLANARTEMNGLAQQSAGGLAATLESVEVSGHTLAGAASGLGRQPFDLRALMSATLDADPDIAGVMVIIEPGRLAPDDPGFDWYRRREGDGRLWFVIGDVSDKGVPAALFMARTVTVLEVAAKLGGSPARALAEAARHLVEGKDTCMFATVVCGKLDLATGELEMASAGHEPPVLLRGGAAPAWLTLPGGPPLGFEADATFETWSGRLEPGDGLLLYTDGVTEAFDLADQAFGEQRLLAVLATPRSPAGHCEALLAAVQAHAGEAPQSDDITVLALHYRREGQGED